jgi:ribonuclease J
MGITISKKNRQIIAGPDIQMRGFVFVKDSENVLKELIAIYKEAIQEYLSKPYANIDETRTLILDKSLRFIRRETGKRPLVIPIIIDSDAN